jgi:hypothetical protein
VADLLHDSLNGSIQLEPADVMARLFVWLRYSATRQLTWQRNYNTQPRILSAAQDRLTKAIAEAHKRTSGARPAAGVGRRGACHSASGSGSNAPAATACWQAIGCLQRLIQPLLAGLPLH